MKNVSKHFHFVDSTEFFLAVDRNEERKKLGLNFALLYTL